MPIIRTKSGRKACEVKVGFVSSGDWIVNSLIWRKGPIVHYVYFYLVLHLMNQGDDKVEYNKIKLLYLCHKGQA